MSNLQTIDIAGYTKMLVPDGVGLLMNVGSYDGYYPSRDRWAQFMAFHNGADWLVVRTAMADPPIMRWRVRDNSGFKLEITDEDTAPVTLIQTTYEDVPVTEWRAVVDEYRLWARAQTWAQKRKASLNYELDFFQTGSTNVGATLSGTCLPQLSAVAGRAGVWLTQYRALASDPTTTVAFDLDYPNYTQKTGFAAAFESYHNAGHVLYPYINFSLWDDQNADYAANVGLMLENPDNTPLVYAANSAATGNLIVVCPSQHATWAPLLRAQFDAIKDTSNRTCGGVYADVICATQPRVCLDTNHGHTAGDGRQWIANNKIILAEFDDLDIMAEFAGEVYINSIDISYAAGASSETSDADRVPLFDYIYGDRVRVVGWQMAGGDSAATLISKSAEARADFKHYLSTPSGGLTADATIAGMALASRRQFYFPRTQMESNGRLKWDSAYVYGGSSWWTGAPAVDADGLRYMNSPSTGAYEARPEKSRGAHKSVALSVNTLPAGVDLARAR